MPRPLALRKLAALGLLLFSASTARATVFSQLQGVVHDPQHRPLPAAHITLAAARSAFTLSTNSNSEGAFTLPNVPLGDYTVTVSHTGFATLQQSLTLHSNTTPILHLQLQLGSISTTVNVTAETQSANVDTVTPTTLISRADIAQTPGADRTNSMEMITDYVPGAYMTHDMLHMRGGHQASWLIDGVTIPNTKIASNVGPQIDPKDIDYARNPARQLHRRRRRPHLRRLRRRPAQRLRARPRGRARPLRRQLYSGEAQLSLGDHTERTAWYASLNANRSNYGLATPVPQVHHDATNCRAPSLRSSRNHTPNDQLRLERPSTARTSSRFPTTPDPTDLEQASQYYESYGLRDGPTETDSFVLSTGSTPSIAQGFVLRSRRFYHSNRPTTTPPPPTSPSPPPGTSGPTTPAARPTSRLHRAPTTSPGRHLHLLPGMKTICSALVINEARLRAHQRTQHAANAGAASTNSTSQIICASAACHAARRHAHFRLPRRLQRNRNLSAHRCHGQNPPSQLGPARLLWTLLPARRPSKPSPAPSSVTSPATDENAFAPLPSSATKNTSSAS